MITHLTDRNGRPIPIFDHDQSNPTDYTCQKHKWQKQKPGTGSMIEN